MTFDDPKLPTRWTHEGLTTHPDELVDLTMDKGTCTVDGRHDHVWRAGHRMVHAHVSPTGVVVMSEGALEDLLSRAGFERTDQ